DDIRDEVRLSAGPVVFHGEILYGPAGAGAAAAAARDHGRVGEQIARRCPIQSAGERDRIGAATQHVIACGGRADDRDGHHGRGERVDAAVRQDRSWTGRARGSGDAALTAPVVRGAGRVEKEVPGRARGDLTADV